MFTKVKPKTHGSYAAPPRWEPSHDKRRSVLHEGFTHVGNMTSDGIVEVAGTVDGDLTVDTLVLTKTARVCGNIRARIITIEGHFEGTIVSATVAITSCANVRADIYAQKLAVEPGAIIEGDLASVRNARKLVMP